MALVATPNVNDVIKDVIAVVASVVPAGVQIVKGISNRVPMPAPTPGFVVITPLSQSRLAWNVDTYQSEPFPTTQSQRQSIRIDFQVDLYGRDAGSWGAALSTVWRDDYAYEFMQNSSPLYMDDGRMMPLVNAESAYEERWCYVATAQYSPVVMPAQAFADAAKIDLVNAQEAFSS